ncbi:putative Transcript elongation factor IIS [Hibiscus syriacus]|uniref:Transcript elongation factor IIS n=1 Tax=Hibiscus syriacus TaxID=106335 RepID=A0A6A3AF46_HIBSY|nr:high mobility group B protein 6-like [Hibiscus syriacus]KAE8703184.1 putative Transcript elongation factor IIS [Hibiscus syriacus]
METESLPEKLSAFRKKMERLRLDKENTEKLLKERDAVLLLQMKEIQERDQTQRHLEVQVDRLFRLKELKSYCMRISPLKSLREKQRGGWNNNEIHSLEIRDDENPWQSSTPSNASQIVRENKD